MFQSKKKRLNKTEFFEITGYPEKIKIVKHNRKLGMKCVFFLPIVSLILQTTDNTSVTLTTFYGGAVYLLFDYYKNNIEGSSFDDAREIAKKYNQDLMVKIYNENN